MRQLFSELITGTKRYSEVAGHVPVIIRTQCSEDMKISREWCRLRLHVGIETTKVSK